MPVSVSEQHGLLGTEDNSVPLINGFVRKNQKSMHEIIIVLEGVKLQNHKNTS